MNKILILGIKYLFIYSEYIVGIKLDLINYKYKFQILDIVEIWYL